MVYYLVRKARYKVTYNVRLSVNKCNGVVQQFKNANFSAMQTAHTFNKWNEKWMNFPPSEMSVTI